MHFPIHLYPLIILGIIMLDPKQFYRSSVLSFGLLVFRPVLANQRMGELTEARVTTARPFLNSVAQFGYVIISEENNQLKLILPYLYEFQTKPCTWK
jgi:hypothetical protein